MRASVALLAICAVTPSAEATPRGNIWSGAATTDGAALYWNPAALAQGDHHVFGYLGFTGSLVQIEYQRAGRDPYAEPGTDGSYRKVGFDSFYPDPVGYLGFRPFGRGTDLMVGAGFFAPYASGAGYGDETGPQRYHMIDGSAFGVYITPTVSYRILDWLSVGGSFDAAYVSLEALQATDLGGVVNSSLEPGSAIVPYEHPLMEGQTRVKGDGWGYGFSLSAFAQPHDAFAIGLAYRHEITAKIRGTVNLTTSPLFDQTFPSIDIPLRGKLRSDFIIGAEWNFGFIVKPLAIFGNDDRLHFGFDFQWAHSRPEGTKVFNISDSTVSLLDGEQFKDASFEDDVLMAWKLRWMLTPDWGLAVRFEWDPSYTPEETISPANLDWDRYELSFGTTWRINEHFDIVGEYGHNFMPTRRVDNSLFRPYASPDSGLSGSTANGSYSAMVDKLGLAVNMRW